MEDFALDIVSFSLGLAIVVVLSVAVMRPALRRPVARVRTPMVKPKPRPLPPPVPVATPATPADLAPASEPIDADGATDGNLESATTAGEGVVAEGSLEMVEGETIEQFRERLKKMSPPKKQSIDPEMLDLANSYDDKVAVTRMIATEDVSRVALVIKHMIQSDLNKDRK